MGDRQTASIAMKTSELDLVANNNSKMLMIEISFFHEK
jgi:hypothetical protein